MSLLVTGSIGIDTVETPYGKREEVIGGSAVYFSCAASFFSPVRLVGVVGEDCPEEFFRVFAGRPIDTTGLEIRRGSRTFRWHGSYLQDLNHAVTVQVDLNVLAEHAPKIPQAFLDSTHVFLANTHPVLQQRTLECFSNCRLAVADTIDLWIENERSELLRLLRQVHGFVLNDAEARLLTGQSNAIAAARDILRLGPRFVVIKKGEHGSLLCSDQDLFVLPAYPAEQVVDPTGAGDSFAGAMMGYLASQSDFSVASLRRAMAYGTIVASFTISDFSISGLADLTRREIDARWMEFKQAMLF